MFPLQILENYLRQVHLKTQPKLLGLLILYRNQLYLGGVLCFILQKNSEKISTLGLFPAHHAKNGFPLACHVTLLEMPYNPKAIKSVDRTNVQIFSQFHALS